MQVYERDRTRTGGLQGYRVGISPNGVRSLRDCLPPELFDTFVATTARDYAGYNMYTERFAPLVSITSDYLLGQDDVIKDYSVSRMTLRQVLLTGLDDIVHFDRKFAHYEDHGDSVTVFFEDGSSATGSVLIGADGANSRIRKQYLPRATQTETGLIAIGGKQALTDELREMLPTGANTALRDAALLCDRLTTVRDGRTSLLAAIGDYERRMRTYSAVAVEESLEFMNDGGTARKPIIGPLTTFGMRTALRMTDRVPALKRRMALNMQNVRDADLEPA